MDSEALAVDEAQYIDEPYMVPVEYNVMNNYNIIKPCLDSFISDRINEDLFNSSIYRNAYYIVCKPYKKDYTEYKEWYTSEKAVEYVRKFLKLKFYFTTIEEVASTPHLNIIAFMKDDEIIKRHNAKTNYYKYYIVPLYSTSDLNNVGQYIIKESKYRNLKYKNTPSYL